MSELYEHNGHKLKDFPANMRILSECKPIYQTLKGWSECSKSEWSNFANKGYDALPNNLKQYITYIEEESRVPIKILSFGPERRFTMKKKEANLSVLKQAMIDGRYMISDRCIGTKTEFANYKKNEKGHQRYFCK